jgi:hypothetical protein
MATPAFSAKMVTRRRRQTEGGLYAQSLWLRNGKLFQKKAISLDNGCSPAANQMSIDLSAVALISRRFLLGYFATRRFTCLLG